MRLAFWTLLLANLILLVWEQGYFQAADTGREPERLQRQINPAQLRIVSGAAVVAGTPLATESVPAKACRRITGLTTAEANSLTKVLAGLPDWQISNVPYESPPMHWVAIPNIPARTTAEKKRDELQQLGIVDHQIVDHATHGPVAISFATLPNESAANDVLQALERKGVRSARVLQLPPATGNAAELRAPAALLTQKLPDLTALFASASVGDCAQP